MFQPRRQNHHKSSPMECNFSISGRKMPSCSIKHTPLQSFFAFLLAGNLPVLPSPRTPPVIRDVFAIPGQTLQQKNFTSHSNGSIILINCLDPF